MVKKYQETANFVSGVLDVTELQNISPFMSKPQKFSIQRALVLSDADYQFFVNDDFRRPPVVISAKQRYMGFDVKKKAWNCLLVVSEISKDGILVGKEPDAERYYMAYVPEHSSLRLRADLPVDFWTGVSTTNLRMQLSTVCFDLRFISYDPEKNEMVTRLYGGPHDYIESRGTPEKIAKENHFSGKLRGIFFNMDYRNISHPCLPEEAPQPKRKTPRKSREEGR